VRLPAMLPAKAAPATESNHRLVLFKRGFAASGRSSTIAGARGANRKVNLSWPYPVEKAGELESCRRRRTPFQMLRSVWLRPFRILSTGADFVIEARACRVACSRRSIYF
jgi:hypothetical protein